jgi:hypothetical protein
MNGEKNGEKLKAKAFPLQWFKNFPADLVLKPDDMIEKNSKVTAKFGDVKTQIKMDLRNELVWGCCTCQQYLEQPCIHIKSLAILKLKELENETGQNTEEVIKKLVEKGDTVVTKVKPDYTVKPKDTPELGKKRAIDMVRSAQAVELQLIKKLDDLDEQIAIKDYTAGSTPLVYEIKTKDKKSGKEFIRYELSIRGWIQAMLYQGNIEIIDVKFEQIGDKTVAKAIVRDTVRNIQTMGFAERVSNKEYFYTTLASKAIRNALKKIISPSYEQKVIKEAMDARLVLTITPKDLREATTP